MEVSYFYHNFGFFSIEQKANINRSSFFRVIIHIFLRKKSEKKLSEMRVLAHFLLLNKWNLMIRLVQI